MYRKVKTLAIPVSPEVAAFAVVLETKLQMEGFDHAPTWEDIAQDRLVKQLKMKIDKLTKMDLTDPHEVFQKAVVIGIVAMMLSEQTAKQVGSTKPIEASPEEESLGTLLPFPRLKLARG